MKSLLVLAPLLLASCASGAVAPTSPVSAARGPALPPPAVSAPVPLGDPVALLARAGQPDALSPRQATDLLGPPDVDRRDGVGALLTWRLPSCALVLGFANERLSDVAADPRVAGAAAPSLAQCVAEASARKARP